MSQSILQIPLPLKGCSQNFHGHWRTRAAHTKEAREAARLLAHGIKSEQPIQISMVFHCGPSLDNRHYRPLDIANAIAAMKPMVDGFVDAGLVPSDSHRWVSWGTVVLNRTKQTHLGRAYVEVTIREVA